jgi:hypothetical protein
MDRAFANDVARLVAAADAAFGAMRWRDGVIAGFFELQAARDFYRDVAQRSGRGMSQPLGAHFVAAQTMARARRLRHFRCM